MSHMRLMAGMLAAGGVALSPALTAVASAGADAGDRARPAQRAASASPVVSASGRYIAFTSSADDLVAGDTNRSPDVFVRDRGTGRTERVSVRTDGRQAGRSAAGSTEPAISGDGRYVAFTSAAPNLVRGDTNGASDVFVRDRVAGSTVRVSLASGGAQPRRRGHQPRARCFRARPRHRHHATGVGERLGRAGAPAGAPGGRLRAVAVGRRRARRVRITVVRARAG